MDTEELKYEPIFKDAWEKENLSEELEGEKSFTSELFPNPKQFGIQGQVKAEASAQAATRPIQKTEAKAQVQAPAQVDEKPTEIDGPSLSFEELRKKLDISFQPKKAVDSTKAMATEAKAEHKLGFKFFENWADYFANVKDAFVVDGESLNSLSRQDDYRGGKVKVLFLGDTFALKDHGNEEDLLHRMILAMKLDKGEFVRLFYDPDFPEETYFHAFFQEVQLYEPDFVVSMGATITNLLLRKQSRLSKVHGTMTPVELVDQNGQKRSFEMMPIFHPEYLKINPSMKKNTWEDLQKLMKRLGKC